MSQTTDLRPDLIQDDAIADKSFGRKILEASSDNNPPSSKAELVKVLSAQLLDLLETHRVSLERRLKPDEQFIHDTAMQQIFLASMAAVKAVRYIA